MLHKLQTGRFVNDKSGLKMRLYCSVEDMMASKLNTVCCLVLERLELKSLMHHEAVTCNFSFWYSTNGCPRVLVNGCSSDAKSDCSTRSWQAEGRQTRKFRSYFFWAAYCMSFQINPRILEKVSSGVAG